MWTFEWDRPSEGWVRSNGIGISDLFSNLAYAVDAWYQRGTNNTHEYRLRHSSGVIVPLASAIHEPRDSHWLQPNNQTTGTPMPDNTAPTPPPPPPPVMAPNEPMVHARIARDTDNKLILTVDARNLHNFLDSIGVQHANNVYLNGPSGSSNPVSSGRLQPRLFLTRQYPMKVNLGELYNQPPTLAALKELAGTAKPMVKLIVDHYHPVDINITLHKRAVK